MALSSRLPEHPQVSRGEIWINCARAQLVGPRLAAVLYHRAIGRSELLYILWYVTGEAPFFVYVHCTRKKGRSHGEASPCGRGYWFAPRGVQCTPEATSPHGVPCSLIRGRKRRAALFRASIWNCGRNKVCSAAGPRRSIVKGRSVKGRSDGSPTRTHFTLFSGRTVYAVRAHTHAPQHSSP